MARYLPFFYRDEKENKHVDQQIEASYFDEFVNKWQGDVPVHKEWNLKEERLTVKGIEMILTDFGTGKNIQWIYNVPNTDQTIHYHIEASNPIRKEELINLAEAYVE